MILLEAKHSPVRLKYASYVSISKGGLVDKNCITKHFSFLVFPYIFTYSQFLKKKKKEEIKKKIK